LKSGYYTPNSTNWSHDRIHNGLGSAVAEVLVETCPVPMRRVGVKERYGQVETQDFLQREYGLTAQAIVAAARE
ncbi:hypothetical protein MWK23_27115, partial [Escherichia coli]|nr:hypothetical protein [Escherichia coli]MCL7277855.1 hypothetical protein [Escherichia coli]